MTATLETRLLLACRQTYDITTAGPVSITPSAGSVIGYDTPQGFVAGADGIDAALLGTADDGIILAFRGTLPPNGQDHTKVILDWLNDADAILVPGDAAAERVHQGFMGSLNDLWRLVLPSLLTAIHANSGKPLLVTGHSKGGSVAQLAARRLSLTMPQVKLRVRTFAAAMPGDEAFATAYGAAISDSIRYEYGDDIVPHLPPRSLTVAALQEIPGLDLMLPTATDTYAPSGILRFIRWDQSISGDSAPLCAERLQKLTAKLRDLDFGGIAKDHSIDPGSGYAKGIGADSSV